MNLQRLVFFSIFLFVTTIFAQTDKLFNVSQRLWTPEEDNVFLQEISQKIPTDNPVKSVAVFEAQIYAVIVNKVHKLVNGAFSTIGTYQKISPKVWG